MATLTDVSSAEAQLEDLWRVRDSFFAVDPAAKAALLESMVAAVLAVVDGGEETASGERAAGMSRARASFLRGRALDAGPAPSKDAEAALATAVKLDGEAPDAWAALGHCFWKRRAYEDARACYERSADKGGGAPSLRALSVLARAGPPRAENYDKSVDYASRALKAKIDDGASWYALGNAHVSRYFALRGSRDLPRAAAAYARAEALPVGGGGGGDPGIAGRWGNPDLHQNRARLRRYVEDYAGASEDYAAARALDPELSSADDEDEMRRWTKRVYDLVAAGGGVKAKKRDAALAALAAFPAAENEAPLSALDVSPVDGAKHFGTRSPNAGKSLACVVLLELRRDGTVPPDAVLVAVRGDRRRAALSVYDGDTRALLPGTVVVVQDPVLVSVETDAGAYVSIQATDASKLAVDGKPLTRVLRATSTATHQ